jgi:hypothetical protein
VSEKAGDAKNNNNNKLITQETQKTGRTKHMKKPINKNPKKKGGLKFVQTGLGLQCLQTNFNKHELISPSSAFMSSILAFICLCMCILSFHTRLIDSVC